MVFEKKLVAKQLGLAFVLLCAFAFSEPNKPYSREELAALFGGGTSAIDAAFASCPTPEAFERRFSLLDRPTFSEFFETHTEAARHFAKREREFKREAAEKEAAAAARLEGWQRNWIEVLTTETLALPSQRDLVRFLTAAGERAPPVLSGVLNDFERDLRAKGWLEEKTLPILWAPIFYHVQWLREHGCIHPQVDWRERPDCKAMLYGLYGALTEAWLIPAPANLIPGSVIRVGHLKHADGWRISFDPSRRELTIESLIEAKSSIGGYHRDGMYQIHGFLRRLADPSAEIEIYGQKIDRSRIFIRTRKGRISINALVAMFEPGTLASVECRNGNRRLPEIAVRPGFWPFFEESFRRLFDPSAFQAYLPSDEAPLVATHVSRFPNRPVGVGVPGRMTLQQHRNTLIDFLMDTFPDALLDEDRVRELLFLDETIDASYLIAVGVPRTPSSTPRERERAPRPERPDRRLQMKQYREVLQDIAQRDTSYGLLFTAAHEEKRKFLEEVFLPYVGWRAVLTAPGIWRRLLVVDRTLTIVADGESLPITFLWDSTIETPRWEEPKDAFDRTDYILRIPTHYDWNRNPNLVAFFEQGLRGHDLKRGMPAPFIEDQRHALGEVRMPLTLSENEAVDEFKRAFRDNVAHNRSTEASLIGPLASNRPIVGVEAMKEVMRWQQQQPAPVGEGLRRKNIIFLITELHSDLKGFVDELKSARAAEVSVQPDFIHFPTEGGARVTAKMIQDEARKAGEKTLLVTTTWKLVQTMVPSSEDVEALATIKAATLGVFSLDTDEIGAEENRSLLSRLLQDNAKTVLFGQRAIPMRNDVLTEFFHNQVLALDAAARARGDFVASAVDLMRRAVAREELLPVRPSRNGEQRNFHYTPEDFVKLVNHVDPDLHCLPKELIYTIADKTRARRVYNALFVVLRDIMLWNRGFIRVYRQEQADDMAEVFNENFKKLRDSDPHFPQIRVSGYHDQSERRSETLERFMSLESETALHWVITPRMLDHAPYAPHLSAGIFFTEDREVALALAGVTQSPSPGGIRYSQLLQVSQQSAFGSDVVEALKEKQEVVLQKKESPPAGPPRSRERRRTTTPAPTTAPAGPLVLPPITLTEEQQRAYRNNLLQHLVPFLPQGSFSDVDEDRRQDALVALLRRLQAELRKERFDKLANHCIVKGADPIQIANCIAAYLVVHRLRLESIQEQLKELFGANNSLSLSLHNYLMFLSTGLSVGRLSAQAFLTMVHRSQAFLWGRVVAAVPPLAQLKFHPVVNPDPPFTLTSGSKETQFVSKVLGFPISNATVRLEQVKISFSQFSVPVVSRCHPDEITQLLTDELLFPDENQFFVTAPLTLWRESSHLRKEFKPRDAVRISVDVARGRTDAFRARFTSPERALSDTDPRGAYVEMLTLLSRHLHAVKVDVLRQTVRVDWSLGPRGGFEDQRARETEKLEILRAKNFARFLWVIQGFRIAFPNDPRLAQLEANFKTLPDWFRNDLSMGVIGEVIDYLEARYENFLPKITLLEEFRAVTDSMPDDRSPSDWLEQIKNDLEVIEQAQRDSRSLDARGLASIQSFPWNRLLPVTLPYAKSHLLELRRYMIVYWRRADLIPADEAIFLSGSPIKVDKVVAPAPPTPSREYPLARPSLRSLPSIDRTPVMVSLIRRSFSEFSDERIDALVRAYERAEGLKAKHDFYSSWLEVHKVVIEELRRGFAEYFDEDQNGFTLFLRPDYLDTIAEADLFASEGQRLKFLMHEVVEGFRAAAPVLGNIQLRRLADRPARVLKPPSANETESLVRLLGYLPPRPEAYVERIRHTALGNPSVNGIGALYKVEQGLGPEIAYPIEDHFELADVPNDLTEGLEVVTKRYGDSRRNRYETVRERAAELAAQITPTPTLQSALQRELGGLLVQISLLRVENRRVAMRARRDEDASFPRLVEGVAREWTAAVNRLALLFPNDRYFSDLRNYLNTGAKPRANPIHQAGVFGTVDRALTSHLTLYPALTLDMELHRLRSAFLFESYRDVQMNEAALDTLLRQAAGAAGATTESYLEAIGTVPSFQPHMGWVRGNYSSVAELVGELQTIRNALSVYGNGTTLLEKPHYLDRVEPVEVQAILAASPPSDPDPGPGAGSTVVATGDPRDQRLFEMVRALYEELLPNRFALATERLGQLDSTLAGPSFIQHFHAIHTTRLRDLVVKIEGEAGPFRKLHEVLHSFETRFNPLDPKASLKEMESKADAMRRELEAYCPRLTLLFSVDARALEALRTADPMPLSPEAIAMLAGPDFPMGEPEIRRNYAERAGPVLAASWATAMRPVVAPPGFRTVFLQSTVREMSKLTLSMRLSDAEVEARVRAATESMSAFPPEIPDVRTAKGVEAQHGYIRLLLKAQYLATEAIVDLKRLRFLGSSSAHPQLLRHAKEVARASVRGFSLLIPSDPYFTELAEALARIENDTYELVFIHSALAVALSRGGDLYPSVIGDNLLRSYAVPVLKAMTNGTATYRSFLDAINKAQTALSKDDLEGAKRHLQSTGLVELTINSNDRAVQVATLEELLEVAKETATDLTGGGGPEVSRIAVNALDTLLPGTISASRRIFVTPQDTDTDYAAYREAMRQDLLRLSHRLFAEIHDDRANQFLARWRQVPESSRYSLYESYQWVHRLEVSNIAKGYEQWLGAGNEISLAINRHLEIFLKMPFSPDLPRRLRFHFQKTRDELFVAAPVFFDWQQTMRLTARQNLNAQPPLLDPRQPLEEPFRSQYHPELLWELGANFSGCFTVAEVPPRFLERVSMARALKDLVYLRRAATGDATTLADRWGKLKNLFRETGPALEAVFRLEPREGLKELGIFLGESLPRLRLVLVAHRALSRGGNESARAEEKQKIFRQFYEMVWLLHELFPLDNNLAEWANLFPILENRVEARIQANSLMAFYEALTGYLREVYADWIPLSGYEPRFLSQLNRLENSADIQRAQEEVQRGTAELERLRLQSATLSPQDLQAKVEALPTFAWINPDALPPSERKEEYLSSAGERFRDVGTFLRELNEPLQVSGGGFYRPSRSGVPEYLATTPVDSVPSLDERLTHSLVRLLYLASESSWELPADPNEPGFSAQVIAEDQFLRQAILREITELNQILGEENDISLVLERSLNRFGSPEGLNAPDTVRRNMFHFGADFTSIAPVARTLVLSQMLSRPSGEPFVEWTSREGRIRYLQIKQAPTRLFERLAYTRKQKRVELSQTVFPMPAYLGQFLLQELERAVFATGASSIELLTTPRSYILLLGTAAEVLGAARFEVRRMRLGPRNAPSLEINKVIMDNLVKAIQLYRSLIPYDAFFEEIQVYVDSWGPKSQVISIGKVDAVVERITERLTLYPQIPQTALFDSTLEGRFAAIVVSQAFESLEPFLQQLENQVIELQRELRQGERDLKKLRTAAGEGQPAGDVLVSLLPEGDVLEEESVAATLTVQLDHFKSILDAFSARTDAVFPLCHPPNDAARPLPTTSQVIGATDAAVERNDLNAIRDLWVASDPKELEKKVGLLGEVNEGPKAWLISYGWLIRTAVSYLNSRLGSNHRFAKVLESFTNLSDPVAASRTKEEQTRLMVEAGRELVTAFPYLYYLFEEDINSIRIADTAGALRVLRADYVTDRQAESLTLEVAYRRLLLLRAMEYDRGFTFEKERAAEEFAAALSFLEWDLFAAAKEAMWLAPLKPNARSRGETAVWLSRVKEVRSRIEKALRHSTALFSGDRFFSDAVKAVTVYPDEHDLAITMSAAVARATWKYIAEVYPARMPHRTVHGLMGFDNQLWTKDELEKLDSRLGALVGELRKKQGSLSDSERDGILARPVVSLAFDGWTPATPATFTSLLAQLEEFRKALKSYRKSESFPYAAQIVRLPLPVSNLFSDEELGIAPVSAVGPPPAPVETPTVVAPVSSAAVQRVRMRMWYRQPFAPIFRRMLLGGARSEERARWIEARRAELDQMLEGQKALAESERWMPIEEFEVLVRRMLAELDVAEKFSPGSPEAARWDFKEPLRMWLTVQLVNASDRTDAHFWMTLMTTCREVVLTEEEGEGAKRDTEIESEAP